MGMVLTRGRGTREAMREGIRRRRRWTRRRVTNSAGDGNTASDGMWRRWWRQKRDASRQDRAGSAFNRRECECGSDRGMLSMVQQFAGGDSRGRHGDCGAVHGALAIGGCAEAGLHVYVADDGGDADGFAGPAIDERRKSVRISDFGRTRDRERGAGGTWQWDEWMDVDVEPNNTFTSGTFKRNLAGGGCVAGTL